MRRTVMLESVIMKKNKFDEVWNHHVYSELDVHFITKVSIDTNNTVNVTLSNSGIERVENWSCEFMEEMYVDGKCKLDNKYMFHEKTSTPYQFTYDMDFECLSFDDKFC